jgi:phage terminase large subunit-like protein
MNPVFPCEPDAAELGAGMRRVAVAMRGAADWDWFWKALGGPVRRRLREEFFAWQTHGGQAEPAGEDWRVWLLMAGRGFGKTLVGAEWVSARARETPAAQIALVGASHEEVVRVMIEGPSGLLAVARTDEPVRWRKTRGIVEFASGAEAFVYSAAAPEALRGPQHHFAWCDELAKWRHADAAWDNLQMGMRIGARPRLIVTTTPKPVAIVRRLRTLDGTVETHGTTAQNAHLSAAFKSWAFGTYGGTRLGEQELEGRLFDGPADALFPRAVLAAARLGPGEEVGRLVRVVVGVDPPASADGDACGIAVCGMGEDGIAYVLADATVSGMRPEGWARAVANAAEAWAANRVIAEKNQGGDMVMSVLKSADARLPIRLVSASRGKAARAEPVALRFENGRAKLAGRFPALEDELAGLIAGGGYEPGAAVGPGGPGKSPDRADAMVWAMTALIERRVRTPRIRAL